MRVPTLGIAGIVAAIGFFCGCDARDGGTATATAPLPIPASDDKNAFEVDVSCGECKFGMKGDGCDLAVRIDGKAYYVTGTTMGAYGDAHAADGFCNAVRHARVTGAVQGDRFVATAFQLLP